MKQILVLIMLISGAFSAHAQKIQMKDSQVILDEKPILSYKAGTLLNEYTFYTLNTTDMVISVKFIRNSVGGVTTRIFFPQGQIEFDAFFGPGCKGIIRKMVKDGVILKDGTIDANKALAFSNKYETK